MVMGAVLLDVNQQMIMTALQVVAMENVRVERIAATAPLTARVLVGIFAVTIYAKVLYAAVTQTAMIMTPPQLIRARIQEHAMHSVTTLRQLCAEIINAIVIKGRATATAQRIVDLIHALATCKVYTARYWDARAPAA
jgi:hypothetical protein